MKRQVRANKINVVTDVTDHFDINVTRAHAPGDIPKEPDTSVTRDANRGPTPARCPLGRRSPSTYETEAIKRYGWRDQGILVISADDQRLTWPERELVRQLGVKLYGRSAKEN